MRQAEYTQEAADDKFAAEALPDQFGGVVVPATETWPRSFIAITGAADSGAQYLYQITQADPQTPYQMVGWVRMVAGASLPPTASPDQGAAHLPLDRADALAVSPLEALADYAALKDDPTAPTSNVTLDQVDPACLAWQDTINIWSKSLEQIKGVVKHSSKSVDEAATAWATVDGGAIVFGQINSTLELSYQRREHGESFTLLPRYAALGDQIPDQVTGQATIEFSQTVALAVPKAGSKDPVAVLGVAQTPVKVTVSQQEES
jgi:hypothetical protein